MSHQWFLFIFFLYFLFCKFLSHQEISVCLVRNFILLVRPLILVCLDFFMFRLVVIFLFWKCVIATAFTSQLTQKMRCYWCLNENCCLIHREKKVKANTTHHPRSTQTMGERAWVRVKKEMLESKTEVRRTILPACIYMIHTVPCYVVKMNNCQLVDTQWISAQHIWYGRWRDIHVVRIRSKSHCFDYTNEEHTECFRLAAREIFHFGSDLPNWLTHVRRRTNDKRFESFSRVAVPL